MNNENFVDTQEILSVINIHNKYAKYIPEKKRRENWQEIIERNKTMHKKKFPQLEKEIDESYEYVLDKKILPSMRSLQFAGKPIEVNPSRIYNCSYLPIDNYKAFGEIMFLLLGGVGVGFGVQKHHIEKLPPIRKPLRSRRFLVGDSIEGWSDAVHHLLKAFLNSGARPNFDFRDIRPKGARLVTAGGKAPGPGPLKICLAKIEEILEKKNDGEQLKPIEAHDIICHIADAVLSGGIRRAACISLFSFDDDEMINAKYGNWWELNPQRARANNSIVLMRSKITKREFKKLWEQIEASKAGEPGISFTNDKDIGLNPCAEISLKPFCFCNLVEVNVSNIHSQEDLNERVKAASFIATLQASYTDFHFLRPIWKKTAEEEALIGVSMTGIADGAVLKYDLEEAANIVKEENERVAKIIGVNKARRCTTVKPSGCVIPETKIRTNKGILSMEEIFKLHGYNVYDYIENSNLWLELDSSKLKVYDLNNQEQEIKRLYINGNDNVYEFRTEDGVTHITTGNHKVLVQGKGWVEVSSLKEDDEIVHF